MARKQIESPGAPIKSWDDADKALGEIAVLQSKIKEQDARYNAEEQKRRAKVTEEQAAPKARILELEIGLKGYCENNRADFGKLKSKELMHGVVSFRVSPPAVKNLKGFTVASALELVRRSAKWCSVFIRTKEELNKEEILTRYSLVDEPERSVNDAELKTMGIQIVSDETFGYDTKLAITNN